jgi:thymidine phosphorylase
MAWKKMNEIINAQGRQKKIFPGKYSLGVNAYKSGKIAEVDNDVIAKLARISGNPEDKGAGIILAKNVNDLVGKGDRLYTVYAHSQTKIDLVKEYLKEGGGYLIK